MSGDQYIRGVIASKTSAATLISIQSACNVIIPHIQRWATGYLVNIEYSGSYAKKTAVGNGSDVDLFISLSSTTPHTLEEIYNSLYTALYDQGFTARKQNVSLGITVSGVKIDLVPAKQQSPNGNDHSIYKRKDNSWAKTNIQIHINKVIQSGRLEEIKAIKIWRDCYQLDFPSINIELAVIEALKYRSRDDLGENVLEVLRYLSSNFINARFVDPSNSNNIISDDMTGLEKQAVQTVADRCRGATDWGEILW